MLSRGSDEYLSDSKNKKMHKYVRCPIKYNRPTKVNKTSLAPTTKPKRPFKEYMVMWSCQCSLNLALALRLTYLLKHLE